MHNLGTVRFRVIYTIVGFFGPVDYFLRTSSSGELKTTLSEQMTALYQCMTFWYEVNYVDGMAFKSSQEVDGNVIELLHSLEAKTGQWEFGEMPLQRRYMNSQVLKYNISER